MIKFTTSAMAAVPRRRFGRPGPDRRQWVIRPEDLLVLAFDLVNLEVKPGEGGRPATLARQGSGLAYLIVAIAD